MKRQGSLRSISHSSGIAVVVGVSPQRERLTYRNNLDERRRQLKQDKRAVELRIRDTLQPQLMVHAPER